MHPGMLHGGLIRSTSSLATEVGMATLRGGGGAVDAVLSGFFALAGAEADVLLAPAVLLVAGVGAGAHVIDARLLQPGREAPRILPVRGPQVPPAALTGVPRSLGLASLALAYHGRTSLAQVVARGVTAARAAGSPERAEFIEEVGRSGHAALVKRWRELVEVAGPIAHGALSEADLREAHPDDMPATVEVRGDLRLASTPFATEPAPPAARLELLVATDRFGLAAALALAPTDPLVAVPALGVRLSAGAAPARRKSERVEPGSPRPCPAPVYVLERGPEELAVVAGLSDVDALFGMLTGLPPVGGLGARAALSGGVGVVRVGREARSLDG
jgi:hypothetical protein